MPAIVGSDGQPVEGIPLPEVGEKGGGDGAEAAVAVPVWVRSETAGRVMVRARVVYGLEGKGLAGRGGGGVVAEAVAATEWARAEVLCVRPLAATVDVVSLQVLCDIQLRAMVET